VSEAGFLLIDKDSGWTSHDVVAEARGITGIKKIGHAGTLDPMATGLLVLGVGRATRLLRFVQDAAKSYVATMRMGVATDTLDADGAVLAREPMPVSEQDLRDALVRFVGSIYQVSARKVEGRRLYELAREGVEVEREARPVTIYDLELTEFAPSDYPEATFHVRASKGTYVRTLADDVARALGGRAHLIALRRTAVGSVSVDDAVAIDAVGRDDWRDRLLPPAAGLADLPAVVLDEELANAVRHGVPLAGKNIGEPEDGLVRMLSRDGRLLAVYRSAGSRASAEVVLS
jgi:tRNA pseudouridine55 synthase